MQMVLTCHVEKCSLLSCPNISHILTVKIKFGQKKTIFLLIISLTNIEACLIYVREQQSQLTKIKSLLYTIKSSSIFKNNFS